MKAWKIGGVWGIMCFLVAWTYNFIVSISGITFISKIEPWSKVPPSIFQKVIFLPLYIAYNLPTAEWFLTLALIPTTILVGALIGIVVAPLYRKWKEK